MRINVLLCSLLLSAACVTSEEPDTAAYVTDRQLETWKIRTDGTRAWTLWTQDIDPEKQMYIAVRQEPFVQIDVSRACANGRYEVLRYRLEDRALSGRTCNNLIRTGVATSLVDHLSSRPEPPFEIRYEMIQLLLALGEIADGAKK